MATLDWNKVIDNNDDTGYEVLPKGDYRVRIVGVEIKTTQTGKTMYAVKSQVQDGPHKGRLLWTNLVVSPENSVAMGILLRHFVAIGLTQDFLRANPAETAIADALMDREAVASVNITTYNGNERNEIKNWKRAAAVPGATPPPPPPAASGSAPTPPVPASDTSF